MTAVARSTRSPRKPPLAPRRRPSQSRSRSTVDALLVATARVLVRRGFAGTTTNHIATVAGVSVGTLYEYFPSKDAMVHALIEAHLEQAESAFVDATNRLAGALPRISLDALGRILVDTMVELHAASPRLHRVLFEEVPHTPAVRRRVRALEDRAATGLAAALRVIPEVRVRDPAIAARLVVDLLEALTHRWIVDATAGPLPATRLADELVTVIVAYLRAG